MQTTDGAHTQIEQIDVMEAYESSPAKLLELLSKIAKEERTAKLVNIPMALDLCGFPSSVHLHRVVAVYGTVLKLGGIKFRDENGKRVDYQEIRIQEKNNIYLPQSITVQLENELVDSCKPGELLRITGAVKVAWNKVRHGQALDCENVIVALQIEKQEAKIVRYKVAAHASEHAMVLEALSNYAPQIHGCVEAKLGLLLCTIGGQDKKEEKEEKEDTQSMSTEQKYKEAQYRTRASSHVLLVGSSGTGKTDLLVFAAKTVTPAVLTTGTGCSSAGLTACALREDGDWIIEPGALPQADKGICCIDDFTSLRKEDKSSILEAMEQQTITVAKAGILMQLDSRCMIAAAARTSARTEREDVLKSLKLSPPLLSRFDLILSLNDKVPPDADVAHSIINRETDDRAVSYIREMVSKRKEVCVTMTDACRVIIRKYYERQRGNETVTIRALESHIRLTEAYAKLVGRKAATENDALFTTLLLNSSLALDRIWPVDIESIMHSSKRIEETLQVIKNDLLAEKE